MFFYVSKRKGGKRKCVILKDVQENSEVIDDYIEDNNPVKFIDAFVDSLDMKELGFKYAETKETGRPPYNPSDIKKLTPDFKTIADFAIKKVCKEFIFLCKSLDLFGCELVTIEGSKFKAVNSKKRNFNERKLKKKIKEIESKIEKNLQDLDKNDKKEKGVSDIDEEKLKQRIEEYKMRKEEYKKLLSELKEREETQVSLTDPDARAMVNNQRIEPCYNVQFTVDSKNKLVMDYEVTNDIKDGEHLSEMGKRAKEIFGKEEIEVLADKGYYNSEKIKECVDNGITPSIPEPESPVSKKIGIPKPKFYKNNFRYNKEKDVYICPEGRELNYRNTAIHHRKRMRVYKSKGCLNCKKKRFGTSNKNGRIIYRWEHEEMIERVNREKEKIKLRNLLTEHIFGTVKRNFDQGYMLFRGKEKVGAEIALTVLVYNIKRVLNILGPEKLIRAIKAINEGISNRFEISAVFS